MLEEVAVVLVLVQVAQLELVELEFMEIMVQMEITQFLHHLLQ